ncbi:carbohydrate ABC transporter permease [Streptomyces sp. RB6PN25]|uniref:Carbohydrate ABC transporter permease n=1 Tax=Streptomyces humicola TaxID=2953240 RepID=A0ABT1PRR1_9ACTN|nr:carbohydrate ABC transporter permease [Streptomyces humicola]MCQ4079237.1 carbohydrate ABC transporter permease [Streptomyces humicola]
MSDTRTLINPAQLNRTVYRVVLVLAVTAFTLAFLGPLYLLVTDGLKSTAEAIQTPPTFYPHHLEPSNYSDAWNRLNIAQLLLNTLWYAFGALAFQLVLDVAAAYSLSKLRPVLGNVVLGMMLATLMIPAMVLVVPQYLTVLDLPLVHLNLLNSPWAIWLPSVANAFNIYLLKRFFDSVPQELLDSASMDGAGPMRTLLSIVLPMSWPIIAVLSVFALVNVWKDFLWPLLAEPDPTKQTLNAGIYSLSLGVPENVLIAAAAISAIPTVLFFLIFQRNIMSGLTAGSLKG